MSSVTALGGAIGVSALALKLFPIPFLWIGLTWAVTGFVIAAWAPPPMRFPIVIAGSVLLAFALGELFLAMTRPPEVYRETFPFLIQDDPLLGWKPKPSQVFRATAKVGGVFIYDVVYSIDSAGHRISPPVRRDQIEGCLFFFSDSFTFGEGVRDHETFPYQVGLKTGGRFRVVNFAAGGYGAEQMLAIIERGELGAHPPCEATHIVYTALPHHVQRAEGKTAFSGYAPRYRLGPDGVPQYLGTKTLPKPNSDAGMWRPWRPRLAEQLAKSRIHRVWANRPPHTTEADIELYFAIVRQAFHLFAGRWPKAELHVVSWDIHDLYSNGQARFHKGLETVGAKVHFIDDILPSYTKDPTRYGLHRLDLHPNPMAHEMVASYFIQKVLSPTRSP